MVLEIGSKIMYYNSKKEKIATVIPELGCL
jgi:hypothetical protein